LIKHVTVQCEYLPSWSVNVCGAAEAPKKQAGKWTAHPRVPWPRYCRKL